ncbi:DUF3027 domain-containing protein [Sanguibacter antarcticus]|uniref:DUF3027 family protein n=1 Tax=Sanguibacter antarcticus TaxID=372484 RepID=A0A2A9E041_9MICO|nr:DUF3027 domain-containing protein [Sanguibacter antarcticus]PFG32213.1 Protein of unknown function (DUF3027) [Sanguibacter antarcticus]
MPAPTSTPTKTRTSRPKPDAVLLAAVDLALAAARAGAEHVDDVGEHLGATTDAERFVSHRFACTMRGYRGWRWTVTVARAPRAKIATVCEVELLPGDGAILAPDWLPWSERLRPGDIGPGDVLPFHHDDPRLVPGYTPTGDDDEDRVAIEELALARVRVLAPEGRDEAAQRWYEGIRGPTAPGAIQSAAGCGSCGFIVPLQGALGQVFGVCANAWSDADGRVVSLDYGCGAHSETEVATHPTDWPAPDPIINEMTLETVSMPGDPASEDHEPSASTDGASATDSASVTDNASATDSAPSTDSASATDTVSATDTASVSESASDVEPAPEP